MAQTIREKAKVRQNRDQDRPTEDDMARAHLGPGDREGKPDSARTTGDGRTQTPSPLDPGHTA
jgi:hypothetical protein